MGDDNSLDECLRAEARVLNLDRTPWHMTWVGVRPQRARRKLDGARVSARSLPVELSWSFRRRARHHGCQPCLRGSPSSRVPSALSTSASRLGWRHTRRGQSSRRERVARRGDSCGEVWVCVRVATGGRKQDRKEHCFIHSAACTSILYRVCYDPP